MKKPEELVKDHDAFVSTIRNCELAVKFYASLKSYLSELSDEEFKELQTLYPELDLSRTSDHSSSYVKIVEMKKDAIDDEVLKNYIIKYTGTKQVSGSVTCKTKIERA